jgi:predicted DNA-binding transcriptional regulator AlpA
MGMPDLRRWLASLASAEASLPARIVLERLPDDDDDPGERLEAPPVPPIELTWRERLWLVPAETRLTTRDVCEAVGHSRSWLYGHMAEAKGARRLPHRKLDGELVFTAGEVRAWLRAAEEVIASGPMESTDGERRLSAIAGGRG